MVDTGCKESHLDSCAGIATITKAMNRWTVRTLLPPFAGNKWELGFHQILRGTGSIIFLIIIDFKPSEFISLQKSDLCQVCLCLDSGVRVRREPTSLVQYYRGYGAVPMQEQETFIPDLGKWLKLSHGSLYSVFQALYYFLVQRFH